MILIRGLSLTELNFSRGAKIFLASAISIVVTILACNFLGDWMRLSRIIIMTGFVFAVIYLLTSKPTNLRIGLLILMMMIIGATVNPVARGVDCVYKIPVGEKISELARADKSLWLVEGGDIAFNDFPIMFGAPTINSVNIYPVLDRWRTLDPTGKDFSVYNRYAHIPVTLSRNATEFKYIQQDCFSLELNPDDLIKLDVRYIFSQRAELENFSTRKVKIKMIYHEAGNFIYSVAYAT